jgi:hypothetical protein
MICLCFPSLIWNDLSFFLQILRCINHLSGDPNCLETLQRTDAIKHLIPILELRDGPLIYQIHSEVGDLNMLSLPRKHARRLMIFCSPLYVFFGFSFWIRLRTNRSNHLTIGRDN